MGNANASGRLHKCTRCTWWRAAEHFAKDASRPSGLHGWCRDCVARKRGEGLRQDPEAPLNGHDCPLCDEPLRGSPLRRWCSDRCSQRAKRLKRYYGLTVDQYRAMVEATGGVCPICRDRPGPDWHVDHDHRTGKVVGVLCMDCNSRIVASVQHSLSTARRLVDYIANPPAELAGVFAQGRGRPGESQLHRVWSHAGS